MPSKTRARAGLLALTTMLGIGLAMPASASASTNPSEIWSTYLFSSTLTGRTTFKTVAGSGVDVVMYWGGGRTETVYVAVLIKRAIGYTKVGSCTQTVPRYGQGWCHISAPASSADHVLYFSKPFNGRAIAGRVYWH